MKLERKEEILKCIVEEFIRTAQPVGSETLLKKYQLKCSSATIRNAMAELEKEGYLEKTHVSSGRVPSSKGYQYYLEKLDSSALMPSVDMEFQREFQEILKNKSKSVEDVLSQSCEVLSEMTKMATVVLGPKANDEKLVSIQIVKLTDNSAMGIFITDSGYVEKKTFVLDNKKPGGYETLKNAVALLNDRLAGTPISELEEKARALKPIAISLFGREGDLVMQAFLETLLSFTKKKYQVYGRKNLLNLPEFNNDIDSFLSAVDTLDDPSKLQKNLSENDNLGFCNVGFTNENKGDFAIISKAVNGKDQIAVVGPKRMDYKKILSALEYVVYMLNKYYFSTSRTGSSLVPVGEVREVIPEPKTKRSAKTTSRKGVKK